MTVRQSNILFVLVAVLLIGATGLWWAITRLV